MLVLLGFVIVVGAVFGGFSLAGGSYQPSAVDDRWRGARRLHRQNPVKTIQATLKSLPALFKGSKYTKAMYMELMALLYEILDKTRKEGLLAIERDIEAPKESALFKKYPKVLKDHHVVEFITDYLRLMVSGKLNAIEITLMNRETTPSPDPCALRADRRRSPAFG
jgi:chemotaxis protein MotA